MKRKRNYNSTSEKRLAENARRREPTRERNEEILALSEHKTQLELSVIWGVTPQRIGDIIRKLKRRRSLD